MKYKLSNVGILVQGGPWIRGLYADFFLALFLFLSLCSFFRLLTLSLLSFSPSRFILFSPLSFSFSPNSYNIALLFINYHFISFSFYSIYFNFSLSFFITSSLSLPKLEKMFCFECFDMIRIGHRCLKTA